MASAEFAIALDTIWADYDQRHIPMACTFGRFHTDMAAHGLTIVPGAFHFSLDVRAYDEAVLAEIEAKLGPIISGIEQRRAVRFHLGQTARAAVGVVDPDIQAGLEAAADAQGIPILRIGSPASHDAAAFAAMGVPVGMILYATRTAAIILSKP